MGLTPPNLIPLASEMRRQDVLVIHFEPFYDLTNLGAVQIDTRSESPGRAGPAGGVMQAPAIRA